MIPDQLCLVKIAKIPKSRKFKTKFENIGYENIGFENIGFENIGFENIGYERVKVRQNIEKPFS